MTSVQSPQRERLQTAFLYLIVSASPPGGKLEELLPRVLEAGVDMVQLREKQMEAGPLLEACETVRRCTEEFDALFIVNDRADVAVAAGADGVHLGQEDLPIAMARQILGPHKLIGLSTHSVAEVDAAQKQDCDYIGVGPVHATPTKPGRPAVGLQLVEHAAAASTKPFFAIGGVDLQTIGDVVAAGASRISVLRAITEAPSPAEAAAVLRSHLPAPRLLDTKGPKG